jgi:hypothetical protein
MCFDKGSIIIDFDELESKLQNEVLVEELLLEFAKAINNAKDPNGSSFTELISGFDLKISIKISELNTKSNLEKPRGKTFFARNAIRLKECLCRDPNTGKMYPCYCDD